MRHHYWVSMLVGCLAIAAGACGSVQAPAAATENTPDACSDGVDNDIDGKVDCADADCQVAFQDTLCMGGAGSGGAGSTGGVGGMETNPGSDDCEIDDCTPPGGGGGGESGGAGCEEGLVNPFLPFAADVHMGVTQGPGCGGHKGKLAEAYDFNVAGGTYEVSHQMQTVAATAGTVVKVVDWVQGGCAGCSGSSYNGGWGNCVVVQIDNSCVQERYCHLVPGGVLVSEGEHVCVGQPLGFIGSTGNSSGAHLHFQRERLNGQSIKIAKFQEATVPSGCSPCTTGTHLSGCYGSTNTPQPGCSAPGGPCMGLASGKYCGNNPQLSGYQGAGSDLVTCTNGALAFSQPCPSGCEIKPPGQNDVCASGPVCGGADQPCCAPSLCDAGLTCQEGLCKGCAPSCATKCGGASDGCGGFCNGPCGAGEVCKSQACVLCGSNGEACCAGNSCDAGLMCNASNFCGCTPNCAGKCGGAPNGCGGFCNGSCGAGEICSGQLCKACGSNGEVCCAGSSCDAGLSCIGGVCNCTPNCADKCGGAPDGCGGSCDFCPGGELCINQSCMTCSMSSSPNSGQYTPDFVGQTNCSCSVMNTACHTLYRGKVVSISQDGWHATLAFQKEDGGFIAIGRKYWVVVGAAMNPSCTDLNAYIERANGIVSNANNPNGNELTVSNVNIWPDLATYNNDPIGATKNIFLITDGAGSENSKTWFQKQALTFTKTCQ